MNLKSLYEDLEGLSDKHARIFETGLELLNYAISETRNIAQNLLPKAIQDYGLELAIESLINHLKINTGICFTYRSEEHMSELQSRGHLVCRLLLEKKKKKKNKFI